MGMLYGWDVRLTPRGISSKGRAHSDRIEKKSLTILGDNEAVRRVLGPLSHVQKRQLNREGGGTTSSRGDMHSNRIGNLN